MTLLLNYLLLVFLMFAFLTAFYLALKTIKLI